MKVKFTPTARKQLLAIVTHIAADRPAAAKKFSETAKRILRRLARFPESGRHLPEFPDLPHREVIIAPYRFFYRVDSGVLWIVAVWHGAQIPSAPNTDVA